MPKIFSNEELAKTRKRIFNLNKIGQGLNNKNVYLDLVELENYMKRAAKNLPDIEGLSDRKRSELIKYLDKAAEAFARLRKKDVLNPVPTDQQLNSDKSSDLEIALHDLSDLKDELLKRDDNGKPLLDTVIRCGKDENNGGFGKNQLLGALDNLDRVLDIGMGSIEKEAVKLRDKKSIASYLEKKAVLDLKDDPVARLLAAAVNDPGSEIASKFFKAINSFDKYAEYNVEEYRTNMYPLARIVNRFIKNAANNADPIIKRDMFLQALNGFKTLCQFQNTGVFVVDGMEFPPKSLQDLDLTDSDKFMELYFDENDQRVVDQTKALTVPPTGEIKLPEVKQDGKVVAKVTPEMIYGHLHLDPDRFTYDDPYRYVDHNSEYYHQYNPDLALLQGTLLVLNKVYRNAKETDKDLAKALRPVWLQMRNICVVGKDSYISDEHVQKVQYLLDNIKEFHEKFPQYKPVLDRTIGPFLCRLDKMDLSQQDKRNGADPKEFNEKIKPFIKPSYEQKVPEVDDAIIKKASGTTELNPLLYTPGALRNECGEQALEFNTYLMELTPDTPDQGYGPVGAYRNIYGWQFGKIGNEMTRQETEQWGFDKKLVHAYRSIHFGFSVFYRDIWNYGSPMLVDAMMLRRDLRDGKKQLAEGETLHQRLRKEYGSKFGVATLATLRHSAALLHGLKRDFSDYDKKFTYADQDIRDHMQKNPDVYGEGAEVLDKEIDKYVMHTVENSNDPLKTYIALHSGNSVPKWQERGDEFADWIAETNVKYLARVAAAYEWKAKNPDYAPKAKDKPLAVPFPIDAINTRAEELLNDPVFKKYVMAETGGKEIVNGKALHKLLEESPDKVVSAIIDPITNDLTREEQIAALTELRDMGDILDHCNGAHEKYKNFFFALKDLGRLDFSKMDRGELGLKLKQIQTITEKSMEKRYTRMLWKAKNEQFDQALDVLAIFKKTGKPSPFAKWADGLVNDVNRARDNTFFKQPHVTLEGRDLANTARRLAQVRKVVSTTESNTLIGIAEKQLRKQPRASSVTPKTKLPKLPKGTKPEETIDLAAKKKELDEFIQLKGSNYVASDRNVPELLALTITAAYKDESGKAVMLKEQYDRSVRIMRQHLATDPLIAEYSQEDKRKELVGVNAGDKLRREFDAKAQSVTQEIEAQNKKDLGNIYNMSEDELKAAITEHRAKLKQQEQELKDKIAQGVAQKDEQNRKTRSEKEDELDKELGRKAGEKIKTAYNINFESENAPKKQKDDDALHTGKLSDRILEKPEPEQQIDVKGAKTALKTNEEERKDFEKTVKQTELGKGGKLM